jgi:hypothetical protein
MMLVAALREALAGRADDLVESRRRFRRLFVVAVVIFAAGDILGEVILAGDAAQQALGLANTVLMTFFFAGRFLTVARDGLLAPPPSSISLLYMLVNLFPIFVSHTWGAVHPSR